MVKIEIVVIVHVGLDGVEVDVHIFELLHQEVARGHALSPWNRVAFVSRGTYQLKTLLCHLKMFSVPSLLSDRCMNDSLEDVFGRSRRFNLSDQFVGFVNRLSAQIVDDLFIQKRHRE